MAPAAGASHYSTFKLNLSQVNTETTSETGEITQLVTQEVLQVSRKLDWCEALPAAHPGMQLYSAANNPVDSRMKYSTPLCSGHLAVGSSLSFLSFKR
jgi:hypothetical protein